MANEVIGSVQVVVSPDTTGFAKKARKGIEKQFRRKNALELDYAVDSDQLIGEIEKGIKAGQKYLDLRANHLKVKVALDWSKTDMRADLKTFKKNIEAISELDPPRIGATLDIDQRALKELGRNTVVTPGVDTTSMAKEIRKAAEKATEDIDIYGNSVKNRKSAEEAAKDFQQAIFRRLRENPVKLEIEADQKKLQRAIDSVNQLAEIDRLRSGHLKDSVREYQRIVGEASALELSQKRLRVLQDQTNLATREGAEEYHRLRKQINAAAERYKVFAAERGRLARLNKTLKLDFEANRSSLEIAEREVREFTERIEENKAQIGVRLDRAAAEFVRAELAAMARDRIVTIHTFLGRRETQAMNALTNRLQSAATGMASATTTFLLRSTGFRLLEQTTRNILDVVPRLDAMIPDLAKTISAATIFVGGGASLLANALTIGAGVMDIANLALFAPTGLAAFGVTFAVMARAFQDFQTELPEVVEGFKALGREVSRSYWEFAADGIRDLYTAVKPLLDRRIPEIAASLGMVTTSLAAGLQRGAGTHLDEFLTNLTTGIQEGATGFDQLGEAIMRLVGIGSRLLPDLGRSFSDLMSDFNQWVGENDANGNLERWIREGATALRDFGRVAWNVGEAFSALARGAASIGFMDLGEFADQLDRAAEVMNSDAFQGAYTRGLARLQTAMNNISRSIAPQFGTAVSNAWGLLTSSILELSGPIGTALNSILEGFNSDTFQNGFGGFIDGIAKFIRDVSPGLGDITAEFGSLLDIVGTAAGAWGKPMSDLLTFIGELGHEIHPGMASFIEETAPALSDAIAKIEGPAKDAAKAIGDLLGDEDFQEFIRDLIDSFADLATNIAGAVEGLADFGGWLSDIYGGMGEGGQSFVTDIITWGVGLGGFAVIAAAFIKVVRGLLSPFKFILVPLWNFFKNSKLGKGIAEGFKKIGSAIGTFLKGLGGKAMGILKSIPTVLGRLFSSLKNIKLPSLGKLGASISGLVSKIVGPLKGLGGRLLSAVAAFLPKGGLSVLLRTAFTRFLGVLTGPVGWGIFIASIIRPIDLANIADAVVDALGLGDTWVGRFTDSIKEDIESAFGDKSILSIVLEDLKGIFTNAFSGDWAGSLQSLVEFLIPQLNFTDIIADAILNAFGFSDSDISTSRGNLKKLWDEHGIAGVFNEVWYDIKNALKVGWDDFVAKVKEWKPVATVINWLKRAWEWVKGLFGFDGGGEVMAPGDMALATRGELGLFSGIWESVKTWFSESWNKLVEKIEEWDPIGTVIDWGKKIVDWVLDLLNIDGITSADFELDWDGIGEKLKTALKTGLIALGAMLAAPALVLVAPLALPALILGWLLGRDEEGNWSFQELTDKVTGAWESIKSAITTGLTTLISNFATLVFTPIKIVDYILKWLFGEGEGMFSGLDTKVSDLIGKALPLLTSGIGTGIGLIKSALSGAAGLGTGASGAGAKAGGFIAGLLGVDGKGLASLGLGFSGAGLIVSGWGGDTKKTLSSTKDSAVSSFTGIKTSGTVQLQGLQKAGASAMSAVSRSISSGMSEAKSSSTRSASEMRAEFAGQMLMMQLSTIAKVAVISRTLKNGMRIDLGGAGRYTGDTWRSGLASSLARATATATSVRSRIQGALSFSAFNSGATIGRTFAQGIRSQIGAAVSAAARLAQSVRSYLPNSPARVGPFSGSGWGGWGESIASELARGLREGMPEVGAEIDRLTSSVSTGMDDVWSSAPRTAGGSIAARVEGAEPSASVVNVNVESKSEDPLQDGRRLGGDIAFALRGAGLA